MYESGEFCGIDFYEERYRVKILAGAAEREKAHRLRHAVFAHELRWVESRDSGLEVDAYDHNGAKLLGVLDDKGNLLACLRIMLPGREFMMEVEFPELLAEPLSKSASTVEISRVCSALASRKQKIQTAVAGPQTVAMLMYKGLYRWCRQNSIGDMYMVVEDRLRRLLKISGFPCHAVGETITMPDGVSAVAVRIDWREFEAINRDCRPGLLSWFRGPEPPQEAV